MKKTLIATAVAASVLAPISAQAVNVSADGTGEVLLYPYYNVNEGNVTFFSVANTTGYTKVMKVRIREGVESEDVLDFQLWLSPFDHWSAQIVRNAAGDVVVKSADTSCTVPALPSAGQPLNTERVSAVYEGDVQSRISEGHVEIFEMSTVLPSYEGMYSDNIDLAQATTHVAGVPADCAALYPFNETAPVIRYEGEYSDLTGTVWGYFEEPQGGVYGIGAVYNPNDGTYFGYSAEALATFAATPIFYPQRRNSYGIDGNGTPIVPDVTADEIALFEHGSKMFDLPDLSTPDGFEGPSEGGAGRPSFSYTYVNNCGTDTGGMNKGNCIVHGHYQNTGEIHPEEGSSASMAKRNAVTTALMAGKMANDFLSGAAYDTDLIFTFPGKYAFRDIARDNELNYLLTADYTMDPDGPFESPVDRSTGRGCEAVTIIGDNPRDPRFWTEEDGLAGVVDREEGQVQSGSNVGFSPGVGTDPFTLCYEVNVVSVNDDGDGEYSGAIASKAVWNDENDSWPTFGFVEAGFSQSMVDDAGTTFVGLPFMGFSAVTDRSASGVNRGVTFMHKITRGELDGTDEHGPHGEGEGEGEPIL